ncbi:MAG TPA: hypothetical protein PKI00_02505 [Candidatus Pacearchaeota archaeon]|nr:hypothetical protein [Candidatus Pacearchaeota archaeon]HQM24741.1 hypothetical protein [Candidatus Pacearchaeota archaeon]
MICKRKGCNGRINKTGIVSLPVSSSGWNTEYKQAYPCIVCGELHYKNGRPVLIKNGNKAFLIDNQIVFK